MPTPVSFIRIRVHAFGICAATIAIALVTMGGCVPISMPVTYLSGPTLVTRHVCIDLNTSVPDDQFLPSLQLALQDHGIASDVYGPGAAPETCEARLIYNVAVRYANTSNNDATLYWSNIELDTLQKGRIVGAAHYDSAQMNNRWMQTRRLSLMVAKLVSAP